MPLPPKKCIYQKVCFEERRVSKNGVSKKVCLQKVCLKKKKCVSYSSALCFARCALCFVRCALCVALCVLRDTTHKTHSAKHNAQGANHRSRSLTSFCSHTHTLWRHTFLETPFLTTRLSSKHTFLEICFGEGARHLGTHLFGGDQTEDHAGDHTEDHAEDIMRIRH